MTTETRITDVMTAAEKRTIVAAYRTIQQIVDRASDHEIRQERGEYGLRREFYLGKIAARAEAAKDGLFDLMNNAAYGCESVNGKKGIDEILGKES